MERNASILDRAIRRIADFPKPGIMFYDITSVLSDPVAYRYCIDRMAEMYPENAFDMVAAIEARGFLFAAPFAVARGLPLVPIRKKGKLPGKTIGKRFDLEYGEDTIEVHADDIPAGSRVLLVDDLIATGGTTRAAVDLLLEAGAGSCEVFAVIGLPFLDYLRRLEATRVQTLIDFDSE
jgi:adenine phosphoribosyltransferase